MRQFWILLRFQFTILIRNKYDFYNQIAFFLLFTLSFPLIGQFSQESLRNIAPSILYIISYLMLLIYQPNMWFNDYKDGTLDQQIIFTSPTKVILSKFLSLFLSNICILYLLLPLFGEFYNLDLYSLLRLSTTLFFFSLSISSILSITSLLCLKSKNLGLLYIISFPLSLATLILSYDFYYHSDILSLKLSDYALLFHTLINVLLVSLVGTFIYSD
jgi:heme exporter protein B